MRTRAIIAGLIVLVGLVPVALAPNPAVAEGVGNVQFSVDGTLQEFPCPDGCSGENGVTFDGTGTGAGNVSVLIDGVAHNATFTILMGSVSGFADYTEPETPVCPGIGTATGTVTLSGGATGVISRTDPLLPTGTVYDVSISVDFTYQRVGVTPVIQVTGGSITMKYFIPGTGQGVLTQDVVGGTMAGVFGVDEQDAINRCLNGPGELDFSIDGDAIAATA